MVIMIFFLMMIILPSIVAFKSIKLVNLYGLH